MLPMLLGAIGGPLLSGMGVGASLGLTTAKLGAGIAGLTSLAQGNDILTAGLDAFGGYGGAGAVGKLADVGKTAAAQSINTAAGNAASNAAMATPEITKALDPLTGGITGTTTAFPQNLSALVPEQIAAGQQAAARSLAANTLTPPTGTFESAGAGLKDLFSPGGAKRFADITGESALTSVGLPAVSAVMGLGGMGPQQMAAPEQDLGFGPFTPLSELRERNVAMGYAQGGIAALNPMMGVFDARNANRAFGEQMGGYKKGGYLDGPGDGMSDSIPATIEGKQPARLADGEFVMPADVVSHLGNGSTKAGAQRLYSMMDKVRKARTGTTKQGKQIKPEKYMPA